MSNDTRYVSGMADASSEDRFAGIRIGRVYLGAFARGLGATASTFYDDEVTAFLAPEEGLSTMLCAAVGRRRRR